MTNEQADVPKNLQEAVNQVLDAHAKGFVPLLNQTNEEAVVNSLNLKFGQDLRIKWDMGNAYSPIHLHFAKMKIQDPVKMTDIIIRSAYRQLNKKDRKLTKQVERMRKGGEEEV